MEARQCVHYGVSGWTRRAVYFRNNVKVIVTEAAWFSSATMATGHFIATGQLMDTGQLIDAGLDIEDVVLNIENRGVSLG